MLFHEICWFFVVVNFNGVCLVLVRQNAKYQNTSFLYRKSPLDMLSNRCAAQYVSTLKMPVGEVTCLPCFSWVPHSCHWCVGVSWRVVLLLTQWFAAADRGRGFCPLMRLQVLCPASLLYRCNWGSGEHWTRSFCLRSSLLTSTALGVGFGQRSLLLSEHGLSFSWVTVPGGREKGWFVFVTRPLAEQQNDGCSVNGFFFPLPFYVSVGFMLSLATFRLPSP